MSWLTEVRSALQGLSVDSVEMSEAVVVKFGDVWLWLRTDRTIATESLTGDHPAQVDAAVQATINIITSRLDRRIWVTV